MVRNDGHTFQGARCTKCGLPYLFSDLQVSVGKQSGGRFSWNCINCSSHQTAEPSALTTWELRPAAGSKPA